MWACYGTVQSQARCCSTRAGDNPPGLPYRREYMLSLDLFKSFAPLAANPSTRRIKNAAPTVVAGSCARAGRSKSGAKPQMASTPRAMPIESFFRDSP